MNMIIVIAALIAFAIAGAGYRVLRKITRPKLSVEDLNARIDIDWLSCSPLDRLLDPSEFEFLKRRGLSNERINALRAKRRSLFRMYMRQLTHEFNTAHTALQTVLVSSQVDRPDLARQLGKQKLLFYRGLVTVEVRLTMNALGFDSVPMPTMDLIRPLERLHQEFSRLMPQMAMSGAQA
jgi:hypothetical protein